MAENFERLKAALASRYAIERELGSGGMATVYLAEDLRHHRQVAVKVLRPELAAAFGGDRFIREIEVAARLQHPNILGLIDSGTIPQHEGDPVGRPYYVMPYVPGESLRDRLTREGELPIAEAVRLLGEVADALAHAHAYGVVHRDIKPDNILLSGRHALVVDFGIARAVSEAASSQRLTDTGVGIGTPAYMAPEQATGDSHLDHRVDIYALGVMGYEMVTGAPPFRGATAQEVVMAAMTRAPEPLTAHRPACPPALSDLILKCLEKRPSDRWQTAEELRAQLEALAGPSAPYVPAAAAPVAAAPPVRGREVPRWLAWAGAGALVAAGVFALTLVRRPEPVLAVGRRIAVAVGPALEQWPALSPDGRTIAYTLADGGTSRLFVQQVDGGVAVPVSNQLPNWQCCGALSPDGSRLLFMAAEGLYVMPTLGGQSRLVVPGPTLRDVPSKSFLTWGSWSPDGQRIAYTAGDTLFVQGLDRPGRSAVASGDGVHSPAWSPDGRLIAFVEGNPTFHTNGNIGPSAIMTVPVRGGPKELVAEAKSLNTSPVWIPRRRALLFISDRDGGRDIYEVALAGSGRPGGTPVRITTGLNPDRITISADGTRLAWTVYSETSNIWSIPIRSGDSVPFRTATQVTFGTQTIETVTASPDGRWLYYDSDLAGNPDIWRTPLGGGAPEQLTTDPAADYGPSVSPDGKEIAFHAFRSGNRDLFVMPTAGGPAVQVTTSPEHDWNPRWSPDGRNLLFDEQVNPDSSLWIVRRRPDGTWDAPRALRYGGGGRRPAWAPDGRRISFNSDSGIRVLDLASGETRLVMIQRWGRGGLTTAWSVDSRTVYAAVEDSLGRFTIRAVPALGGRPRTLAYADDPLRQRHRHGLAVSHGRLFFPLFERRADVWVGEIEKP